MGDLRLCLNSKAGRFITHPLNVLYLSEIMNRMVEIYKNYTQNIYLLKYGFIRLILIKKALYPFYDESQNVRNISCIGPSLSSTLGISLFYWQNKESKVIAPQPSYKMVYQMGSKFKDIIGKISIDVFETTVAIEPLNHDRF